MGTNMMAPIPMKSPEPGMSIPAISANPPTAIPMRAANIPMINPITAPIAPSIFAKDTTSILLISCIESRSPLGVLLFKSCVPVPGYQIIVSIYTCILADLQFLSGNVVEDRSPK